MEEKKIVYELILDIWGLAKNFGFEPLSDSDWERYIYETDKLYKSKYKQSEERIEMLFRQMLLALTDYYENKKVRAEF